MKELSTSLKEFIENQELMRIAYTDSKGFPRVVPVWYVVLEDNYYVGTYKSSAKWKAIEQDSRMGWVIDGGEDYKYKGVSRYGHAEEVTDADQRATVYNALGVKYFGSTDDPNFLEIYGQVDNQDTLYMRLKEDGGNSWEY